MTTTDAEEPTLTIDELATRAGVTVRTVRFYGTRGLLPPPVIGPRRVGRYGRRHLARLSLIEELQHQGMTLAAIERYLGQLPPDLSAHDLALHRAVVASWAPETVETVTREELGRRAGRPLTDEEVDRLTAMDIVARDPSTPAARPRDDHAPDGQAPSDGGPHGRTPDSDAPHRRAPDRSAPHGQAPDRSAPHDGSPDDDAPNSSTPHGRTPDDGGPHARTPPDSDAPHRRAPDRSAPHGQAPGGDAPHSRAPGGGADRGVYRVDAGLLRLSVELLDVPFSPETLVAARTALLEHSRAAARDLSRLLRDAVAERDARDVRSLSAHMHPIVVQALLTTFQRSLREELREWLDKDADG